MPLAAFTANVPGGLKGLEQGLLDVGIEVQEVPISSPKVLPWEDEWKWRPQRKERKEAAGGWWPKKAPARVSQSEEAATVTWVELRGSSKKMYSFIGAGQQERLKERTLSEDKLVAEKIGGVLRDQFLPVGYPHSVSPGFLAYTCWHTLQECANAAISVISTQSLLLAAGLRPTPAQATIVSWVLKDGMQHVGKLIGSSNGARMDAEPKRWRLFADLMFDIGAGLEVLSPLCPNHFLSVAGLANLSKGVSLVAARSTRLPIYNAFAREGNLGDLHTKGEAIGVFSNLLGMAIGIRLASTVCNTMHGKILTASALSAVHLFASSREMRSTPLNTLNGRRTGMLIKDYLETGKVPRPAELAHKENFLMAPQGTQPVVGDVQLNVPISKTVASPSVLAELVEKFRGEKFILNFRDGRTDMVLHPEATGEDAVRGWLLAACAAQIVKEREGMEHWREEGGKGASSAEVGSEKSSFAEEQPPSTVRRRATGATRDGSRGAKNSDHPGRHRTLHDGNRVAAEDEDGSAPANNAVIRGKHSARDKRWASERSEVMGPGTNRMVVIDEAYARMEGLLPPLLQGLREAGWHTHLFAEGTAVRAAW
ncbi:hypothetical protein CBR_g49568 [Chara braunii]|uniref:Protein root UVB sensitive/RUS domain-containing protein n=1 Tax=Chara braunii TaxID=69332 RepID=A0A388M5D1_CHABU|nr:hypothetical protein CBR_g49568 [Chara braunii]|eukprot:GBG89715.1 hypothetical protein CBR_g49568 [Chara braunii]